MVLVLEGLIGLDRTVELQFLHHYWLGHRVGTVILNCLPWKRTEIILSFLRLHHKYCISDVFVDYDGYSISSKGFSLTVVDIMII